MSDSKRPGITPLEDGPLLVTDLENFHGPDGPLDAQPKMALCRCGKSENKPFCDGSHADAKFTSKREPNDDDGRLVFEGDPITVYENVAICSHAGFCPKGKPDTWRPKTDDGGHSDEEIIEMIRKCPSGALSYAVGEEENRDPEAPRPPQIEIMKDGPIRIEGGVELRNTEWGEAASREHYTLCRCGASKMKPFCDGAHDQL